MLGPHQLLCSPRAAVRQRCAARWVAAHDGAAQVLVLAPSLEAGSRVLRLAAEGRPAAFGWQRATPSELAARLASRPLASEGRVQVGSVVLEAVAARMVHTLGVEGALGRFAAVGDRPGLPRALASTFVELGMAGVEADELEPDLARLYRAYRRALSESGLADLCDVYRAAASCVDSGAAHPLLDLPVVLFDVALPSAAEASLVAALGRRASVRAVVPSGDRSALRRLSAALGVPAAVVDAEGPSPDTALTRLSTQLFSDVAVAAPLDASVEIFSAPGESRECVEIARRVLSAADQGVPFDRMAVLTHAPGRYRAHLVEAFRRANIEAHFSRGTVRPDPAGRALLALLECAAEGLSARAFATYLSLGVVPDDEAGAPPSARGEVPWLPPEEGPFPGAAPEDAPTSTPALPTPATEEARSADATVVAGSLRAPWRWERLIVEAAVIGGVDRWRRRLDGLEAGLAAQRGGLSDPDDALRERLDRSSEDLRHLRGFALPLLEELARLPRQATWGEWAEHLAHLAERAIEEPARVLSVLRELSPMGPMGPVGLLEVQLVLARRLTDMVSRPTGAPAGKLYVASTDEARGMSFDLVFVPGLAERVFPRKVVEDPIALDALRRALSAELTTTETRVELERLALRLAVGAAEQRVVFSYPRLDTERGRPRVPSFYGLEVLRAVEGVLPSFEELASRAEAAGAARMAWPAPARPDDAIDGAEYDLAVLRELLDENDPKAFAGAARYLVEANPHLARSLRARFSRWSEKWTRADGMVNPSPAALEALAPYRLDRRPYSATALQRFAACPYRFYLATVFGLGPRVVPEAADELDPLSRGNLIHQVQFALLARLRDEALLPVTEARHARARAILDEVLAEVVARFAEELAPAIDRVWRDAVADVTTDLREWLFRMTDRPDWVPVGFELAFGLEVGPGRDPASVEEPVHLAEGILLRGAIDLVERRDDELRATDHKTGAAIPSVGVIAGGRVLQPVLYARALEELHKESNIVGGRLYFCTGRGRFTERLVPLTAQARESVSVVAEVIGRSVEEGFLPAAPGEGECEVCDYRTVCGPSEERRVKRKRMHKLGPLRRLRKQP